MSTEDLPQIYLVTPSVIDLEHYPDQLARVLDMRCWWTVWGWTGCI